MLHADFEFHRKIFPEYFIALLGVFVFFFPVTSPAQGIEEIVVTAQKREESLQDVPISVVAFTGDTLS